METISGVCASSPNNDVLVSRLIELSERKNKENYDEPLMGLTCRVLRLNIHFNLTEPLLLKFNPPYSCTL